MNKAKSARRRNGVGNDEQITAYVGVSKHPNRAEPRQGWIGRRRHRPITDGTRAKAEGLCINTRIAL